MSEALEEIAGLFETRSFATNNGQRRGMIKKTRNTLAKQAAQIANIARAAVFYDETSRQSPTLPRVRWLERPDP